MLSSSPLSTPNFPKFPKNQISRGSSGKIPSLSIPRNQFPSRRMSMSLPPRPNPSQAQVEMVRTKQGIWAPKQQKVVLLWDLDNKPPRGPPYDAAMSLRRVAELFGHLVDMSAYANRHTFIHLPNWVLQQRRQRRLADALERRGLSPLPADDPYVCGVCGRRCRTRLDLKKHFRQLHERERQKKLSRLRQLRGKRRRRYKERFISGNHKYDEAARELITPRVGYGLATELRRAGVFVKTVEDKPQAADWALKRQMQHSMSRRIDWLFLVSDDSDFSEMLRRARDSNLRTVVVGDSGRALSRQADIWVSWIQVENGEVDEDLLKLSRRTPPQFNRECANDNEVEKGEVLFSLPTPMLDDYDQDGSAVDSVVDDIVLTSSGFNGSRISAFSEEDLDWDSEGDDEEEDYYH